MQIHYQLDATDLEAFFSHVQKNSPVQKRVRRLLIAIIIVSFIVIHLHTVFGDKSVIEKTTHIILSLTRTAIVVILILLLFHWSIKKGMRRVINDRHNAFHLMPYTLVIDESGLQSSNDYQSTHISWNIVTKVVEDMERIFIYYGSFQAFIIPKCALRLGL